MEQIEFYVLTIAVFSCLNGILALGFNMQFGFTGIINLAYIVLVAVGAYATSIAALPPAAPESGVSYIGGFGWAFPWDLLFGFGVTMLFALVLGGLALRRLRHDYLAISLVAIGAGLQILVTNDFELFDGSTGIGGVPGPGDSLFSPIGFQVAFLGIAIAALAAVYLLFARVAASPLGRALKGVREDEDAVASLGKSPWRLKMVGFMLGAAAAGLGGGLFATYIGGWNTQGWLPQETLFLLAAVLIGGRGRNFGALAGSVIAQSLIAEIVRFMPQIGEASLLPSLEAITIGLLLMAFLWWRPEGIFAEQKERFSIPQAETEPRSLEDAIAANVN